jgi:hypothetical protein
MDGGVGHPAKAAMLPDWRPGQGRPKEGLGNDNTPASHMWRTLANPDAPL